MPGGAVTVAIFYVFLWASAYVPSKVASVESEPLWFLVIRFGTAGVALGLLALARRDVFPRSARGWIAGIVLGVLSNALYLGLTYTALRHLSAGLASIVASANPLILALVAPFVLGERLSPLKALGLVLGFGGVLAIVLARGGSSAADPRDVTLAFAGVCASVASTVVYKRFASKETLLPLSAIQLCAASIALVPFAAFAGIAMPHVHVAITRELVASFVYLVLVLSIGATLIWFRLLAQGEASRVSAYYYLTPVFGLSLGAVLLGEPVSVRDLLGLAAIALGIVLAQRG